MNKKELISNLRNQLSRDELVSQAKISNYTITKYNRKIITELGQKIIDMRSHGATVRSIASHLGCSKSTVSAYSYVCDPDRQITLDNIKKRAIERKNKSALERELNWIAGACKRGYKGSFNYQTIQYNYRDSLIKIFGNKCNLCDRRNGLMDFHHIDPDNKIFNLTGKSRKTIDEWATEANKCVLLCKDCHGLAHSGAITVDKTLMRNITPRDIERVTIDIKELKIKPVQKEVLDIFCRQVHYLGPSRKGHIKSYGCYYNDTLIACALINNPTRNESKINGLPTCELARFLILGRFRFRNVASKFLSLIINILRDDTQYHWIISFADMQYHLGTIYKAANFIELGTTSPSYNYGGIHKKTIYERAKRLNMTERQYVDTFKLSKITEDSKIKFGYQLR